jgi:hypothetical protein
MKTDLNICFVQPKQILNSSLIKQDWLRPVSRILLIFEKIWQDFSKGQ